MRKIYSLVLMTVMLLIGTNVWADAVAKIGTQTYATIEEAFAEALAASTSQTIELIDNAPQTTEIRIEGGKEVTLNMNGKTIEMDQTASATDAPWNFYICNGKLNVIGGGEIRNATKTKVVSTNPEKRDTTNFQNTNGKEVLVFRLYGTTDTNTPNYTVLNIAQGTKVMCENGKAAINIDRKNTGENCAYGVVVDFDGTCFGQKYGIQVSGKVTQHVGNNIPYIHVNTNAVCYANQTRKNACGIYAAGYAKWLIEGYVYGATGAYIKSGEVTFNNAQIESTYTGTYTAPEGKSSGVAAGGSAIVVESNASYAGDMNVVVTGDTEVTGGSGYAIDETITTANNTKVETVDIQSGTITGGDAGAIIVTPETKQNNAVTVEGGTWSDNTAYEQGLLDNKTFSTTTTNEEGKTVVVISNTGEGGGAASTIDWHANADINTLTANDYLRLETGTATQTLTADREIKYLKMEANTKVIIPAGMKLTVGEAVLDWSSNSTPGDTNDDTYATIEVKPGAELIVTGEKGLYSVKEECLIIGAQEDNMGIFMFQPTVTSNKNPKATVKLISKGRKEGGKYIFQRFGVPAAESIDRNNIAKPNPTYMYKWDYSTSNWLSLTSTETMYPFVGYSMTTDNSTKDEYSFPVSLVGNNNGELNFVSGWNYFANSYTAKINVQKFVQDMFENHGSSVNGVVYAYNSENNWWFEVSEGDIEEGKPIITNLDPMQAFIFHLINGDAYDYNINYKDMVWDPIMNPSPAPARRNANWTRANIIFTAANGETEQIILRQGDRFTEDFDNGFDVVRFMNPSRFNVYATTDVDNMSQIASDNLIGQMITLDTKEETSFKMSFSNVRGETLYIKDVMTGTVLAISEDAEYYFTTLDNNVENRFEIVNRQEMPTSIETINEQQSSSHAIYTIMGQYVGSDWNSLPAGVYVVDGVKMVK